MLRYPYEACKTASSLPFGTFSLGSVGTKEAENYPQPHYWYYDLGGTPYGPYTFRKVAEWFAARYFGPKTLVARCVHDTAGALVAITDEEANASNNGLPETEMLQSDEADTDSDGEKEEEEYESSEEKDETTDLKKTENQGATKIPNTAAANKEWLARQFKERIKNKEKETEKSKQKKGSKGIPLLLFLFYQ